MISEVAYFDVSRDNQENDRRVVRAFYAVPKGSKVILFLGSRPHGPFELLDHFIRDYILDFAVEFQGEPHATRAASEYVQERCTRWNDQPRVDNPTSALGYPWAP